MAGPDDKKKRKAEPHRRINLAIWGDDDWLDLGVDAQMLYLTLYTSPGLSYCGAHEWHPGKLAMRSLDWTVERIERAAAVLSEQLFLIIDTATDECLLRSWIKHDGLWRTPNMAVSMANARAALASRTLRGVVVHEVLKLRAAEPESSSWEREPVAEMLTQRAVAAADLEPFTPASTPVVTPQPTPAVTPPVTPGLTLSGGDGVNTPLTPTPTPAINSNSSKESAARGRRLPTDWMPAEDTIAAMRQQCPGVDLKREHAKFLDHWTAQPGAKGRKSDWDATWRNWMRRAYESLPANRGHGQQQPAAKRKGQAGLDLISQLADAPQPNPSLALEEPR
ncbi:hypothetical protein [Mycolicibacterium sp.]|uniref:hypothetical protein n=1 Tax=Mycolicibacterium sp. TaxID=2320850 RepID=UPI0037CB3665